MNLLRGLMGHTDCRIHNESESVIKLIPKSYVDAGPASNGFVRQDLVREIQPGKSIDVDSRKYDLNGRIPNTQIKIHFAASPNGVEAPIGKLVFFHYELKEKGKIYLGCGKDGKVVELKEESPNKGSTITMQKSKK